MLERATFNRAGATTRHVPKFMLLALVALLPIHVGVPIAPSIFSWGFLLAIPLMPVILRGLGGNRTALLLTLLALITLVSGALLTRISASSHDINTQYFWVTIGSVACAFFVLFPGIRRVAEFEEPSRLALAYAAGLIVEVLASPSSWDGNIWKFGLSFPVSLALFAVAARRRSLLPTFIALAAIAAIAIVAGDRSYFGFAAIIFVVVLLPRARRRPSRGKSVLAVAALALSGIVIYIVGVSLALAGYLGARNQLVTAAQLHASGSVLSSGRSESGAAVQLFLHRPIGYGPGVLPTAADVAIGQQGLVGRGLDLTGQYVREYLFGTGFKLHSIASDLWVNFGLAGLALAILLAFIALRALTASATSARPNPLLTFVSVIALWNLAFSPIGSNLFDTLFCVALLSAIRSTTQDQKVTFQTAVTSGASVPGLPATR